MVHSFYLQIYPLDPLKGLSFFCDLKFHLITVNEAAGGEEDWITQKSPRGAKRKEPSISPRSSEDTSAIYSTKACCASCTEIIVVGKWSEI